MKPSKNIRAAIGIATIFVACLAVYGCRFLIGAWLWQLKNHGILKFGIYEIPVPKDWYVSGEFDNNILIVRVRDEDKSGLGNRIPVTIRLLEAEPVDLARWASLQLA